MRRIIVVYPNDYTNMGEPILSTDPNLLESNNPGENPMIMGVEEDGAIIVLCQRVEFGRLRYYFARLGEKHDRKYESPSIQEALRLAGSRKARLYRCYNHDEFINHILAGHVVDQPGKEEYGT